MRSIVLAAFVLLILVPFWLWLGSSTLGFLKYHAERGLQIESVPATIALMLQPKQIVVVTHGAIDLPDSPAIAPRRGARPFWR